MANDKIYIIDEQDITIKLVDTDSTQLNVINDDVPTIVKIYEPGQRGPKGSDAIPYIPTANIISSSAQISSDISGSFINEANELHRRIDLLETATSSFVQNTFTSSYNSFKSLVESKIQTFDNLTSSFVQNYITSSFLNNEYSESIELRVKRLEEVTSSYAVKLDVSASFSIVSASLANRLSNIDGKTLISSSNQVIYSEIDGIPSNSVGIISSSNQVDFYLISNKPINIISGSEQLTSSYDLIYERKGQGVISSSQQINTLIPSIVSSSSQINSGSFSGSFFGNGENIKGVVSSAYADASMYASTASYVNGYILSSQTSSMSVLSASYAPTPSIPSNLISSSAQIASDISGSFDDLRIKIIDRVYNIEQITSSLNSYKSSSQVDINSLIYASASIVSKLNYIESLSGSYATTGSNEFSGNQKIVGLVNITGSVDVFGQIYGNFNGDGSGLTNINSSSYAISASYAPQQTSISSSYSLTSSYSPVIQTIGVKIKTEDIYITEGSKGYKHIGYNSRIVKVRGISNVAGNININVMRNGILLGNYQLSNTTSSIDTNLIGWTTTLQTDDLIEFYVSQSSMSITDVTFFMDLKNI